MPVCLVSKREPLGLFRFVRSQVVRRLDRIKRSQARFCRCQFVWFRSVSLLGCFVLPVLRWSVSCSWTIRRSRPRTRTRTHIHTRTHLSMYPSIHPSIHPSMHPPTHTYTINTCHFHLETIQHHTSSFSTKFSHLLFITSSEFLRATGSYYFPT